jgi:transposase
MIGEEETEVLDYKPGQIHVLRYTRPKYKRVNPDGSVEILIADLPGRAIQKGVPAAGMISYVITDKYMDHLPLYRQSQRFKREGNTLSR